MPLRHPVYASLYALPVCTMVGMPPCVYHGGYASLGGIPPVYASLCGIPPVYASLLPFVGETHPKDGAPRRLSTRFTVGQYASMPVFQHF